MTLILKDRVKETTTTTGTGTLTLAGAATGFQSFSVIGNGNETYYSIVDSTTGDFEVGIGTYTSSGTTLSRTTVLSSSSGGAPVSFTAGSKDVFVTYPSSRAVFQNLAGTQTVQQAFDAITANSINATTATLSNGTVSAAPVNNTDIVNKQYADAIASGIHFHEAVELATAAALPANTYNNGASGVGATLTGNANGILSVDSTVTVVGNRVLVKNEVAGANNGVYVVAQVGTAGTPYILTRATDFDSVGTGVDQIDEGDFFLVINGTTNQNAAFVQQTPPPIVVGTTAIVFQQFAAPITYTAGTGLNESPAFTFNIINVGTAGTYGSASSVPVFTTNAQGQVTGVTPTAIAISGAAVSGNITGASGSVANTLTLGSFLTGTSFNGSAAVTAAVDATSANTVSKVVARDASGNFSAGTITAALSGNATTSSSTTGNAATATNVAYSGLTGTVPTWNQNTTGNAATATALQTARTINGTSFNGTANITITAAANGGNSSTVGGLTPSASAGVGSRIVAADGNGYIFNNYFNSTDNSQASGVTNVMVKAGDNYLRSGTAAAVATFISGQAMNISGSSTSCSGNAITASRATRSNGFFYIDDNFGLSTVGLYNPSIFQGWYAMGDAYKTTAGGGINNLYGVAWSHPNAGGIASNLDSHGMIVAINGGFASCLSYNVKASANVTAFSDERLKRNWEPLCDNFVEKLASVKVGTYERIDLPIIQVGVSAQSLEKVLPEAVSTATDDLQTKSVAYGNAALASAVMLAQEIVELKKMMQQMQAELAELKRGV